jgi:MFS family permease
MGWRSTLTILAALLLFGTVPANALLIRRNPGEVGQFPDGEPGPATGPRGATGHRPAPAREWTLGSAVRSVPFWSIAFGHLALGTGLFMIYTHVVAHLVEQGSARLAAAFIVGLMGFMRTGGTVFWGFISDRIGRDRTYGISVLIALLGIVCLMAITPGSPAWLLYGFVILYGVGHSAGNPTYGAVIGDIFSGRKIGLIFGFLEISFGLGSALGSWIGGYLFDTTGSYAWSFTVCLVCFVISGTAIHTCVRWHARQMGAGN